jgi:hypothetical protein
MSPTTKEFIIPLPMGTRVAKKLQVPEYFPSFVSPPHSNTRQTWHNHYHEEIFDMFELFKKNMKRMHPKNKIHWDDINLYNDFSKLLFETSSGYV